MRLVHQWRSGSKADRFGARCYASTFVSWGKCGCRFQQFLTAERYKCSLSEILYTELFEHLQMPLPSAGLHMSPGLPRWFACPWLVVLIRQLPKTAEVLRQRDNTGSLSAVQIHICKPTPTSRARQNFHAGKSMHGIITNEVGGSSEETHESFSDTFDKARYLKNLRLPSITTSLCWQAWSMPVIWCPWSEKNA